MRYDTPPKTQVFGGFVVCNYAQLIAPSGLVV